MIIHMLSTKYYSYKKALCPPTPTDRSSGDTLREVGEPRYSASTQCGDAPHKPRTLGSCLINLQLPQSVLQRIARMRTYTYKPLAQGNIRLLTIRPGADPCSLPIALEPSLNIQRRC